MTIPNDRLTWRKSSHSSGQGDCVEVATNLAWRKSSRSGQGDCGEVGTGQPGVVAIRDSKDPAGPVLLVSPGSWRALLRRLDPGRDHG